MRQRQRKLKKIVQTCLQWLLLLFAAVICGYAFVTFFYQTVTVVGPSMEHTLSDGQVVLVDKLHYRFHEVKRYDVVAFSKRNSDGYYSIKRVVGLPGETIRILNGEIYIDGERLTDLPFEETIRLAGVAGTELKLSKDEYFVLGDNVNNSEDSRYTNVGNVSKSEITGKVVSVLKPKKDRKRI